MRALKLADTAVLSVPGFGVAAQFQNIDRETPMPFSACIQEWVPDNALAHFIIDAVATLNLDHCGINHRAPETLSSRRPQLPAKAADADSTPLDDGLTVQAEIARRATRQAQPRAVREVIEARARTGHHRTVEDLEKKDDPPPPGPGAPARGRMIHRTATKAGKTLYKQRQQTVEPVVGIIKPAMGFRRSCCGAKSKRGVEWSLVSLACAACTSPACAR